MFGEEREGEAERWRGGEMREGEEREDGRERRVRDGEREREMREGESHNPLFRIIREYTLSLCYNKVQTTQCIYM